MLLNLFQDWLVLALTIIFIVFIAFIYLKSSKINGNGHNSAQMKLLVFVLCLIILIMHRLDKVTRPEMAFTMIYLIPIAIASWFSGIYYGVIIGLLCTLSWFDVYVDHIHFLDNLIVTNIIMKFSIFMSYAVIIGRLKEVLDREKALSRINVLTGLANTRAFQEALNGEIDRSTRHERVLSMLYMDIDNFKTVNDNYGHNTGDRALRETAKTLKSVFRSSDTVARLGGDEFAVLLPETDSVSALRVAEKLRCEFLTMSKMNNWQISLSIGAATFTSPPRDTDKMIKLADDLMYSVKQNGKNNIKTGTMVKW